LDNQEEDMSELTKEEQQLGLVMRAWAVVFGIAGLVFLMFPGPLFDSMNMSSKLIFGEALPPIPPHSERFWGALALSLMTILTTMSWTAGSDVRKYRALIKTVLISKFASTFFFILFFFTHMKAWAYIVGALLSDGPIFVIILVFYMRAVKSAPLPD
jgi:hypothetical protein